MQFEILECGSCSQRFGIPVEDFGESDEMCCPYCQETKRIYDVVTVEVKQAV